MKRLVTVLLVYTTLSGCASHNPPVVKHGKFVAINSADFTPPNATLYKKGQVAATAVEVVMIDDNVPMGAN